MLTKHREAARKDGGCWSPTAYPADAKRSNAGVEAITLAAFDFDQVPPDWRLLDGLEYVASTTYSHTAEDPHWRVVLPRSSLCPRTTGPRRGRGSPAGSAER